MATQDAVTNALAALSGSTAAIVVALAAAVAVWLGAEYAMNALDMNLPMRQLMQGRNLQPLTAHWRYARCVLAERLPWMPDGHTSRARRA